MNNFILILFVFINFSLSTAQEVIIKAANSKGKAALFFLSGEKSTFMDSISSESANTYKFNFNNNHPGFYRLIFKNKKWIDFIYDNDDIELETDADNILEHTSIIKSEENKIYYNFIKINKDYKTKTELLQLILARYPKEDEYYSLTKEKLIQVQEEYLYFVNVVTQANPSSFIARYVKTSQLPVIDAGIEVEKQLTFLKTHSLDHVDFNDVGLIYSNAFTNKTIEYLSYYRNPQLPMGLLEKEFESAIDSVLNKAKVNDIVYKHIVEYMLDGFKKFGFDKVINYIVENYVIKDEICLDEKLEKALERRIQQSKDFKIGNTVPNILLPDSSGILLELNKVKAEKTLIIFYASWCPHCKTLLPEIYKFYRNQQKNNFEVFAVSIDSSREDWLNFVRTYNMDWLNVCDLKGWNGKSVLDYYIYATPTMFLINSERKIMMIPTTIEEFKTNF